MIALVVGAVAAVVVLVRVIVVARTVKGDDWTPRASGGVSHRWIDDNIYKREGGDR